MEIDIQKLAKAFEATSVEGGKHNGLFEDMVLKEEGRKLELLAGRLLYLAKKDLGKQALIERAAKLILIAGEELKKL